MNKTQKINQELVLLGKWEKWEYPIFRQINMEVSKNMGTPKSSIFIGFSMKLTIHFGVPLHLWKLHETSI